MAEKARGTGITGLLLIFTLLSLICFIRAQSDKEYLEILKAEYQTQKQDVERKKEQFKSQRTSINLSLRQHLNKVVGMIPMVKKTTAELPGAFPPTEIILEKTKVFLEKAMVYFDMTYEKFDKSIKEWEEDLREVNEMIDSLEKKIEGEPDSEEEIESEEDDD